MRIRLCLFDLDGTLTDTIESIAYFANLTLQRYGYAPIETERYKLLVGDGAKTLIERALRERGGGSQEEVRFVLRDYNQAYHADSLYKTTVYGGIRDLLAALKEKEMKLAVLSNKPHDTTLKIVDALFDQNVFDLALGAREGRALKPDPEGALEIMDALGVRPNECLYVGDTDTDMHTGNAAGAYAVGVLWGFREEAELAAAHAWRTIREPMELLSLLGD